MTTKLHFQKSKQLKTYLSMALFLVSLLTFSQEIVATSNIEITGVTLHYFFD
ncbi:hypothetical protein WPG_3185 [Winogradskyella sp. PG-2]|nr:hypothetical protein WPG_3185 [Winogradskyella sp. PG-2]